MDFVKGLQRAIDYIENHLTDEIDYERIAQQAACSTFYYQRIFSVLCDMSVGDYIRRRCLTLAGRDLNISKEKVMMSQLNLDMKVPNRSQGLFPNFTNNT